MKVKINNLWNQRSQHIEIGSKLMINMIVILMKEIQKMKNHKNKLLKVSIINIVMKHK